MPRMKVKVKLYGTLSQRFPGYQPLHGIEVEIPDDAKVKDLLAHLKISESEGTVVVDGRVQNTDNKVLPGIPVIILQAIRGG